MSEPLQASALTAYLSQNLPENLRGKLTPGQVITAHILEKMPGGDLLMYLDGQTFNAKSRTPLLPGQTITARVQTLDPSLILQLKTNPAPPAPQGELTIYKNALHQLGYLPTEDSLNAAKAILREGLPLRQETLAPLLQAAKNLPQPTLEDFQGLARMQRLQLPLKPDILQAVKTTLPTHTSTSHGELMQQIDKISQTLQSLPPETRDNAIHLLDQLVKHHAKHQLVLEQGTDTLHQQIQDVKLTSGQHYEHQALTTLAKSLTQAPQVPLALQTAESVLPNLRQAIQELPVTVNSDPIIQEKLATLESLFNQSHLTLKPSVTPIHDTPTPLPDLLAKQLTTLWQQADLLSDRLKQVLTPQEGALPQDQAAKLENALLQFKNALLSPVTSDPALSRSMLSLSLPRLDSLKSSLLPSDLVPQDQKALLLELKTLLDTHRPAPLDTDPAKAVEPALKPSIPQVIEFIENELREVLRTQLGALDTQNPQVSEQLMMLLSPEGSTNPFTLHFQDFSKQQGEKGEKDENQAFRIFFSLELSALGYFEINMLEQDKKLDVHFFSASEEIRGIFDQHNMELVEALKQHGLESVTIHSHTSQKPTMVPPLFTLPGTPSQIDITA